MKYLNKNISIVEIFKLVRELEGTVDDKAQLLAQYDRKDVRWLIDFAYNGPVPLTIPTFKRSIRPYGIEYMTVLSGLPKLNSALQYIDNPTVFERNIKLVLENISPEESDLLVEIFSGKKFEGVSKAVLKRVYPAFFRQSDEEAV